jgi:hypothetical protein
VPSLRDREEWVANLRGFWPMVWAAQDALKIPRYRDARLVRPLPDNLPAVLVPDFVLHFAQPPYVELGDSYDEAGEFVRFPRPPENPDEMERKRDWWLYLVGYAISIVTQFELASSDLVFVIHCIYGGIETVIAGVYGSAPPARVVVSGDEDLNRRGRVYVDVTESVEPERDVKALLPEIEAAQSAAVRDIRCRRRRSDRTRGRRRIVWAFAELLHGPHGPLVGGLPLTWEQTTYFVNKAFGTSYESDVLEDQVVRWRGERPPRLRLLPG